MLLIDIIILRIFPYNIIYFCWEILHRKITKQKMCMWVPEKQRCMPTIQNTHRIYICRNIFVPEYPGIIFKMAAKMIDDLFLYIHIYIYSISGFDSLKTYACVNSSIYTTHNTLPTGYILAHQLYRNLYIRRLRGFLCTRAQTHTIVKCVVVYYCHQYFRLCIQYTVKIAINKCN